MIKIDIDDWDYWNDFEDDTFHSVMKVINESIKQLGIKAKVYKYRGIRIAFKNQNDLNLCMLTGIIKKQDLIFGDEYFYTFVGAS